MQTEATRPSIADQIDFAAASLDELQALMGTARLVGGVAHAASWQGRCQSGARLPAGNPLNAAGAFMHWLGDALNDVESMAADELQRRRPTNLWDRQTRLAAIAQRVIENDDVAETAAFIRELTVWAAEEARR